MNANCNFPLLRTRTKALETALFYNFSEQLLKFPTSLIRLSDFDDNGILKFEIKKPYEDMSGISETFPGRLHFYKKGTRYHVRIEGTASVHAESNKGDTVTIAFKIAEAELLHIK